MVVLNDFLPISILSLKTHFSNKLMDILDDKLDYYIETSTVIKKNDKKRLFNNIVKEVKNIISSDHFLYLIMDNNYCTHKYKKGKNEGKYCAKKIRSNNPKKVYLCCSHDKDHVPKKKNISVDNTHSPMELINNNIDDNNKFKNKIEIKNDPKKKNININYNNQLNNKVINNFKTDINIKIEDIDKSYETNSNNKISICLLDKKEKKNMKIQENQLENKKNDINKKIINTEKDRINSNINLSIVDIDNCLNINKVGKNVNINKKNKYNNKHCKKYKWRKLDILQDTGFIFG